MKKIVLKVTYICLAWMVAPLAHAELPMEGHWIFGGLEAGGGFLSNSVLDESDKKGFHGAVKGLYSHYWDQWVADVGAGYMYNWLSGEIQSGGVTINDKTITKAAVLELSPRYRLTKSAELGLQTQAYTGTDTRFATTGDQITTFSAFSGPQLVFNLSQSDLPIRFSFSVLTDWNVQDRQVFLALIGIHGGFQLGRKARYVEPRPEPALVQTPEPVLVLSTPIPSPSPVPEPTPAPSPVVVVTEIVRKPVPDLVISFDMDAIHFRFDNADISPRSRKTLQDISQFILSHSGSWNVMDIGGHTDSRGATDYNQALSERRANRVMQTMLLYGVPKNKIAAKGFGEMYPREHGENEIAWAKNRRVEMIFDTVTDIKLFKTEIEKIRSKYGSPEIYPYSKRPTYRKAKK